MRYWKRHVHGFVVANSGYTEWLQSAERLLTREDAILAARWGALAETTTSSCVLDVEVDAIDEAARQMAFKSGPLVEDVIVIPKPLDLALVRGRVWTITIADDDIYAAGRDVFVLGGDVMRASGITTLYVLRRL